MTHLRGPFGGLRHLAELEPELRSRLRALDEPVSRESWAEVLTLARAHRPRARVAGATVVLSSAAMLAAAAGTWLVPNRPAVTAPHGAAGQRGAIVLYSKPGRTQFVNALDDRKRGQATRWLDGFNTRLRTGNDTTPSPAAGDESMAQLLLYTSATLEHRAGAGVLMCHYVGTRNALCDASFRLSDGHNLTATGLLGRDGSSFSLALTGGSLTLVERGDVEARSLPNHLQELKFHFVSDDRPDAQGERT